MAEAGSQGKKGEFRYIRLSKELSDHFEASARAQNRSFEELASEILTLYREKYSRYEQVKPLAMYPSVLTSILEYVTDEDLKKTGAIEASNFHKYAHFVFNDRKQNDVLQHCLTVVLPTSGWFSCEVSKGSYTITHSLGRKWSVFLSSFLSALTVLNTHKSPFIEVDGEKITLSL